MYIIIIIICLDHDAVCLMAYSICVYIIPVSLIKEHWISKSLICKQNDSCVPGSSPGGTNAVVGRFYIAFLFSSFFSRASSLRPCCMRF